MLDFGYFCMDCMDGMKQFPDKFFDVAIVDPPYGLNAPNMAMGTNKSRSGDGYPAESTASKIRRQKINHGSGKLKNSPLTTMNFDWDSKPPGADYFRELFRVSKNQIIWGGNYFELPPTRGIVAWDKIQPWDNFSQFELAWTSYDVPAKLFRYSNTGGANIEEKIHPTQKPIALYEYLISTFRIAGGYRVLDTHVGSASSLIALRRANIDFVGFEIDPWYYQKSKERYERETAQITIFQLGIERRFNE